MKKTLTLKKNFEFKYVFNRGKWQDGKYISVYVLPNKKEYNLLGIAVGKKVAKSVKRNKIRRRIREAYRLMELELLTGYSMIIVWKTRSKIEKATLENIQQDLRLCFEKAGIIK